MTVGSSAARATDVLARPFSVGSMSLPNRIAMAPMTRAFSPGGVPGADVAQYYARRAAGGVGLIITEGTYVGHPAAGDNDRVPRFHGDEALAGWSAVVEAVHLAGGRIVPQLWHMGMAKSADASPASEASRIGPSGVPLDDSPHGQEMARRELDAVVGAFVTAAAAAEATGFDGIEIHGAHGYLIDQFLWAHTNHRSDGYGGDAASRARFAAEIVAACRQAVSPSFPIIFRTSQWKSGHFRARIAESPQDLEAILAPLAEAGVDAFHCSTRRYWQPEFDGSDLNLAGWAKKLTGRPAISVGSVGLHNEFIQALHGEKAEVTAIDRLLDRMERDEFDLVAVGRALLGDPDWAAKTLGGRTHELTPFDRSMLSGLR
ncbi:NADH:flavin oxidoreductase [Kitasatospora sp. NPDC048296]|uniref:NADH:flavin oxidoreductase n=1 Tax=Kitasatospora sp. NPDC048296 TaxID=3364048 RepID=UPI003712FF03